MTLLYIDADDLSKRTKTKIQQQYFGETILCRLKWLKYGIKLLEWATWIELIR